MYMEDKMDNNKRQMIIIILSIAVIVILLFHAYTDKKKLDKIEQQLQQVQSQVMNQNNSFSYDINRLQESINESMSLINNYSFEYEGINTQENTVKFLMTFDLKEIHPNAKYYICHSPVAVNNFSEVEASASGGTVFTCSIELPIEYNYKFNIIEKTDEGGIKQLNNEEIFNHVYNDYANRTQINSFESGENEERITYNFSLSNNSFGITDYEIKSVELYLFYENIVVYQADVTDKNTLDSNTSEGYSTISEARMDYATKDETTEISMVDQNYFLIISKDKLREQYPDIFNKKESYMSKLKRKIIVKYQNGGSIELEI